jgi:mono/diheme cytochrome c family protein
MNNARSTRKFLTFASLIAALALFLELMTVAQEAKPVKQAANAGGNSAQVARGKYLVNDVAMCVNCHTPRNENGKIEPTKLLMGTSTFFRPAQAMPDWPQVCPRIGGTPPGTDEEMVTLLTTGIWNTGQRLRDPMPQFRMTREDAEAVVAYLKSLK